MHVIKQPADNLGDKNEEQADQDKTNQRFIRCIPTQQIDNAAGDIDGHQRINGAEEARYQTDEYIPL